MRRARVRSTGASKPVVRRSAIICGRNPALLPNVFGIEDQRGLVFAHNVRAFGALYLIILAALWIGASPDYFTATHGTTADGRPTGNLAYASICFGVVTLAVCTVSVKSRGRSFSPDAEVNGRCGSGDVDTSAI